MDKPASSLFIKESGFSARYEGVANRHNHTDGFQNNLWLESKKSDTSAWMSDSSSMKLKNRKNKSVMTEIWIACDRRWGSEKGAQRNWRQESL